MIAEARAVLVLLAQGATVFMLTFLAGALVGTFIAGVRVIVDLVPVR